MPEREAGGHSGIEVVLGEDNGRRERLTTTPSGDMQPVRTTKIRVGREALREILEENQRNLTQVYTTIDGVARDLKKYFPKVPEVLPAALEGRLLQPDGAPAADVELVALEPEYGADEAPKIPVKWPNPSTLVDARGTFRLQLPSIPIPKNGLKLEARGASASEEISLRRVDVAGAKLGTLVLTRPVPPLVRSILAQAKDIVPASASAVEDQPTDFAAPAPGMSLGEGECARSFRSNAGVIDRFPFAILIRLVEPQVTPRRLVLKARSDGDGFSPLPLLNVNRTIGGFGYSAELAEVDEADLIAYYNGVGTWRYADRQPVNEPIDVTQFRDAVELGPARLPKASTLGLGYTVRMHQTWVPAGLSLGDLVYSLPLAPGEQQKIAVFERAETLAVTDTEQVAMAEAQSYAERADSSTHAVFNSAAREAARGGSHMETDSSTWGVGGATGAAGIVYGILMGAGISGGYGSSSSSGTTSSWQSTSRDFTSNAAQDLHSALARSASASRRANRTGMRLASESDREQVTTKTITNHNHGHALTMQYWEVLRHYAVETSIDDVQLVCFVPLELVQWLPDGEPRTRPDSPTRADLMRRYAMILRHKDTLDLRLRWRPDLRHGLDLLESLAADYQADVQTAAEAVDDTVKITITGTFLPMEDIRASVVTRGGVRIGPVKLTGTVSQIPGGMKTRSELIGKLRSLRSADAGSGLSGELVLPTWISRADIARVEIERFFRPYTYQLVDDDLAKQLDAVAAILHLREAMSVALSAADLEREVGGPRLLHVIAGVDDTGAPTYVDRDLDEVMLGRRVWAARRVTRAVTYDDQLAMENVFTHVLRNSVEYSRAVWQALTPEERAIMLEPYTIGVPDGGVHDASDEVPLLNCVANQVLGFFGNAMVMPFAIPPKLAGALQLTSRDVQDALLKFHRQAFNAPRSAITLSARGVLGEAVLGSCSSNEKIDLTRFWNWKDAPSDTAADLKPSDIQNLVNLVGSGGAQAPSQLAALGGPQNNLLGAAPAPSSELLAQLIAKQPAPTQFSDLTGIQALGTALSKTTEEAGKARDKAIDQAATMAKTAMEKAPDAIKAQNEAKATEQKEKADKEAAKTKADADKLSSKLTLLSQNANWFIGQVGNAPDSDAKAKELLGSFFDGGKPTLDQALPLFEKLAPAQGDTAEQTKGKKSILKTLGL